MTEKRDPEKVVREIKRKTRRKYSSEEKIRIVLEGLRGGCSASPSLEAEDTTAIRPHPPSKKNNTCRRSPDTRVRPT